MDPKPMCGSNKESPGDPSRPGSTPLGPGPTHRPQVEGPDKRREPYQPQELEAIYDSAPVGLCVLDRELRYVRINRRLAEIHGFPPEAHIGQPLIHFVPDLVGQLEPALRRILQTGQPLQNDEIVGETPAQPGVRRAWIQNWSPLRDRQGKVVGLNGVIEEITGRKQVEAALRLSEQKAQAQLQELESIYRHAPVGLCVLDRELRIVRLNQRLAEMNGLPMQEHLDKPIHQIVPDLMTDLEPKLRRVLATGEPMLQVELTGELPNQPGVSRTWLESCYPLKDAEGQVIGLNGVIEDVTEAKLNQRALQASEQRLRLALEASGMGSWEWDLDSDQIRWSDNHYRILGYQIGQINPDYRAWQVRVHPEDLAVAEAKLATARREGREYHHEHRILRTDGSVRWIEARGRFVYDPHGQPRRMYGVMADITGRKQAETQLEEKSVALADRTEQLEQLAAELVETEQRERKRLAQVLHDHLQQKLFAARRRAGLALERLAEMPVDDLQKVLGMLGEAIQTTRTLATQLHPAVLHELGLVPALQWLGEQMHEQYDLQVQIEIKGEVHLLGERGRILLFDTARELLFNVVKHARVDQAKLVLTHAEHQTVCLCVEDHGRGFDPQALLTQGRREGLGLLSLRERLTLLGGRCTLRSTPGQGTRVEVVLPLTGLGE